MEIKLKEFHQLSVTELYQILQLRSAVFVVEQNCVYQDIDGNDQKALHVLGIIEGSVVAYTRCFGPGAYFDQSSIGRVIVAPNKRGAGLGHVIMKASIEAIEAVYKQNSIAISAQTYLEKFYQNHGFSQHGSGYLEDGIPHIKMINF